MVSLLAVSGIEVLKWIGYFFVALICLMLMIMLHELGHYTFGKIFKFKINEFSIGFGPKLLAKPTKRRANYFPCAQCLSEVIALLQGKTKRARAKRISTKDRYGRE